MKKRQTVGMVLGVFASMRLVACSSGDSPSGDATAETSEASQSYTIHQTPDGEVRLSGGVEVAAEIRLPNGNTALFLVAGERWSISESGPVGNVPAVDRLLRGVTSPVAQFEVLAPGQPVPASIASLAPPGPRLSHDEMEKKRSAAEEFKELERQAKEGELQPSADGLNAHNGSCGATWFDDNICVDFENYWGDSPSHPWFHFNRTARDDVDNSSVWNGKHFACADRGTVTLQVEAGDYAYDADVLAGHWRSSAMWSHWESESVCVAWDCETFWFGKNTSADSRVTNVSGTDRFHYCGWYDRI